MRIFFQSSGWWSTSHIEACTSWNITCVQNDMERRFLAIAHFRCVSASNCAPNVDLFLPCSANCAGARQNLRLFVPLDISQNFVRNFSSTSTWYWSLVVRSCARLQLRTTNPSTKYLDTDILPCRLCRLRRCTDTFMIFFLFQFFVSDVYCKLRFRLFLSKMLKNIRISSSVCFEGLPGWLGRIFAWSCKEVREHAIS